jgi:hypothetical protein
VWTRAKAASWFEARARCSTLPYHRTRPFSAAALRQTPSMKKTRRCQSANLLQMPRDLMCKRRGEHGYGGPGPTGSLGFRHCSRLLGRPPGYGKNDKIVTFLSHKCPKKGNIAGLRSANRLVRSRDIEQLARGRFRICIGAVRQNTSPFPSFRKRHRVPNAIMPIRTVLVAGRVSRQINR